MGQKEREQHLFSFTQAVVVYKPDGVEWTHQTTEFNLHTQHRHGESRSEKEDRDVKEGGKEIATYKPYI